MLVTRVALLNLIFLAGAAAGQSLPHPDHIVVVIEENKGFADVIDASPVPDAQSRAKYINNKLVRNGALLTQSFGLHHPSQPNYLELFSGSSQNVCDDSCPHAISADNLAKSLRANPDPGKRTFLGYAEAFVPTCSATLTAAGYAQKHCPWRDFTNPPPASVSKDLNDFPADFTTLPAVSFVIPSITHDMHNPPSGPHNIAAEVKAGDAWLQEHLEAYRVWAMTHNSILIVTWDEDSDESYKQHSTCNPPNRATRPQNHIPTIIVGQHVIPNKRTTTPYDHRNVLRTILDMEGVPAIGGSATAQPITGIWQ